MVNRVYAPFAGIDMALGIWQGGMSPPSGSHDVGTALQYSIDFSSKTGGAAILGAPIVSPFSGEVVGVEKSSTATQSNPNGTPGYYNLGNFVTIKSDTMTHDGKPVYITLAHMVYGSNSHVDVGDHVSTGQVIGAIGGSGGDGYPIHLHIQFGTKLTSKIGSSSLKIADGSSDTSAPVVLAETNTFPMGDVPLYDPPIAEVQSSFHSDHYGTIRMEYTDDPIKIYALKTVGGTVYDGDAKEVKGTDRDISVGDMAYAGADTLSAGNNGWMEGKTGADTYVYTVGQGSVVINDNGSTEASETDVLRIISPNLLDGITIEDTIILTPTDNHFDLQLTFNYNQPVASGTVTINDFFTESGRIERLELYGESEAHQMSFFDTFDLLGYWNDTLNQGQGGGGDGGSESTPDESKIHFDSSELTVDESGSGFRVRIPVDMPQALNNTTVYWQIEPIGQNPVDRHDFDEGGDLPYTGSFLYNKNMIPVADDVVIDMVGKDGVEGDETFLVALTGSSAGSIDQDHNTAIVTVRDDGDDGSSGGGGSSGSSGGGSSGGGTGTGLPSGAYAIFEESQTSGWQNWSWDVSTNLASRNWGQALLCTG